MATGVIEGQLALVDGALPPPKYKKPGLAELPPDEELVGPPPTADMVRSVRQFGVLEPVLLIETEDGYHVEAGRRRIKAARAAELDRVPAMVYPEGSGIRHVGAITENELRSSNDATTFIAVEALMDEHGVQHPQDVARALGVNRARVEKLMSLRGLVDGLLDAFRAGALASTAAHHALKLPEAVQKELAAELEREGSLTVARVKEARQVRVQKEMATIPDDVFGTPSATDAGALPAWPLEDDGNEVSYGTVASLDELDDAVAEAAARCLGPGPSLAFVDRFGARWIAQIEVSVTLEKPEEDD